VSDNHLNLARAMAHIYRDILGVSNQGDVDDAVSHLQISDVQPFQAIRQARIVEIHAVCRSIKAQAQAGLDEVEEGGR